MSKSNQLSLFFNQSINPTQEIKRQIRRALSGSKLSRDQIVDLMNDIASREGFRLKKMTKAILDSWCKDSGESRLPSIRWLVIFCRVMKTPAPIAIMAGPLGFGVIGPEDMALLNWAKAEREKEMAQKRARLAKQMLEIR